MKTLLFCVLYPGVNDTIIREYVRSIQEQEDDGFDWLIVNDHAGSGQLGLFPDRVRWIDLKTRLSFGRIRELGISRARDLGYDYIVFSDIDDFYSSNRMGETKRGLATADFVFTELQIVNLEGELTHPDFLRGLRANPMPSTIHDLLDYNCVGLSHSAVRLSALDRFEIPSQLDVVDWWVFSLLLLQGHRGLFLEHADTFYRQSPLNYVGVLNPLTPQRLTRGIKVKLDHYEALGDYCRKHGVTDVASLIAVKHREIDELRTAARDPEFRQRYIADVNRNLQALYRGWWSEIIPLPTWKYYAG
jgi:hypothetical protein